MAVGDREPPTPGEAPFLSRWSARKAEARRAEDEARAAATAPAEVENEPPAIEPPAVDLKDLPDIDTLDSASDFKPFMRAGVPSHLRTLALRKLWRLDPTLANLDGLIDYGEDFTDASRVVANLQTAYKVGRGFLDRASGEPKEVADPAPTPPPSDEPRLEEASSEVPSPSPVRDPAPEPARRVDERPAAPRPLPKRG